MKLIDISKKRKRLSRAERLRKVIVLRNKRLANMKHKYPVRKIAKKLHLSISGVKRVLRAEREGKEYGIRCRPTIIQKKER